MLLDYAIPYVTLNDKWGNHTTCLKQEPEMFFDFSFQWLESRIPLFHLLGILLPPSS